MVLASSRHPIELWQYPGAVGFAHLQVSAWRFTLQSGAPSAARTRTREVWPARMLRSVLAAISRAAAVGVDPFGSGVFMRARMDATLLVAGRRSALFGTEQDAVPDSDSGKIRAPMAIEPSTGGKTAESADCSTCHRDQLALPIHIVYSIDVERSSTNMTVGMARTMGTTPGVQPIPEE